VMFLSPGLDDALGLASFWRSPQAVALSVDLEPTMTAPLKCLVSSGER